MKSSWQERSEKLFDLAAEVALATGHPSAREAAPKASGRKPSRPSPPAARKPSAKPPRPAVTRPAAPATDDEKARRLWRSADNFIRNGALALGKRKLNEIIRQYPQTEHARKAREKLKELAEE